MRRRSIPCLLSVAALTLAPACGPDTIAADDAGTESAFDSSDDVESSSSGSESETDESESGSSTQTETSGEAETETSEETETETGGDPLFDPTCGEWSATKIRALGLNDVWTDGIDIVAGGDVDLIERGAGDWIDYDDISLDAQMYRIDEVWGPAVEDHWLLGADYNFGPGVYHFDGQQLTRHVEFTFPEDEWGAGGTLPLELTGSGPADIWALAIADCDCFEPCPCEQLPSQILHYDGQTWTEMPSPGQALDLAIGGTTPWVVGSDGLAARFDGQAWISEPDTGHTMYTLWAVDDDEVWAGGQFGRLLHRSGGVWTESMLPDNQKIVAMDGRSAVEVWALDDTGQVWAYDGAEWTLLTTLSGARELAVLDDALVIVGEDEGHWITRVETGTGTTDPLFERPNMLAYALLAVNVDTELVSSQYTNKSWRWTEAGFEPAYPGFELGFNHLVGSPSQGFATRNTTTSLAEAVWRLEEPTPTPIEPDPVGKAEYRGAAIFEGELWVAGSIDSGQGQAFVSSYDGQAWTDRTPALANAYGVRRMSVSGSRVFVHIRASGNSQLVQYYEDGQWTDLGIPSDVYPSGLFAAAEDRLWMTASHEGVRELWLWDGRGWLKAADLWPELLESTDWLAIDGTGPSDVWVLSATSDQSEKLAHFDGESWTIIDSPALLHGWLGSTVLAVGEGVLLAYDGQRIWRYAYCPI